MRVIQITDLHIVPKPNTKLYGVDPYRSLERVLTAVFSEKVQPDVIIATGDLAEDGSRSSYERLRLLLSNVNVPVFVLPGNHDCVESISDTLVGGNISMPAIFAKNGWKFVLLNSQVVGHGHGEIKSEDLKGLEALLREAPADHFLVGLHHTPLTPCPFAGCRLYGRESLLRLVEKHENVRCVISGHAHEDREEIHNNALVVTTPATFAQAWHAQDGESFKPDDFWASHYFDPSKSAFRSIDLNTDGTVNTKVHWLSNG